ncbi:MAG TPA: nuclear transport factor 2 family protein [Myxococcales bacterium]|jgi:ketosteroid isomerase-like protein|nr:nuclear transport factor 2 family protein [Myxococcales bacterium]
MPLAALARRWLSCFDTKDVDELVSLYAEDARHYSPKLRALRPETGGCIQGRAALRDWWADAFRRLPQLRYVEQRVTEQEGRVTAEEGRVVLEYLRLLPGEPDLPVAEVFEVRDGVIHESRVYHG